MAKTIKQIAVELEAAKIELIEIEQEYHKKLFFETMPTDDPMYAYNYNISCMSLPRPVQSVDAWLRAVIQHMSLRRREHGGAATKAVVVSVPDLKTQAGVEKWIAYSTKQLRKQVKIKKTA